MSIYTPCDIRGKAVEELTPDLYRRWGRTLGSWVEPKAKFVIGGDLRDSTPLFLNSLSDGLSASGVDVVNLGQLPTPMIYYAKNRLRASGCAVVTASHNASEWNGLKWLVGDHPPGPEEVQRLRSQSNGAAAETAKRPAGSTRGLDISFDYVAWLQERWADSLRVHRHIVLDPMHGCWSARARRYLNAIFPECLLSAIHDWSARTLRAVAPIVPSPTSCTTCARRCIAGGRTWASPLTATETGLRWSTTTAWR